MKQKELQNSMKMAFKMDKSNIVNTFTSLVEQLRNKECSQSEKIACFQHIAECIMSTALAANINYATHCSTATNVLLLFCEDLDSVVRMSAEENLNKIFRVLEKTRVSRILMDLYGEIKRNGNQRSLRICLNLFAHYAPHVREKHLKWYALRLLACMQTIAQRKETLLCETLCEFVKCFGKYLQIGLTDSETCRLLEVFLANIAAECAVKRRCAAQNCISLIENSRNKSLMAKHGLNKVIDIMLLDQRPQTVLGALTFLRLLLPLIIRGFSNDCSEDGEVPSRKHATMSAEEQDDEMSTMTIECKKIIEIYDYCLHLLSTSNANANHSIINAALEVISAILHALDHKSTNNNNNNSNNINSSTDVAKKLFEVLSNQRQLQHNEMLQKRKSLKNQIFQLRNYNETTTTTARENISADTNINNSNIEMLLAEQQQHLNEVEIVESNVERLATEKIKNISADCDDVERRSQQQLFEASVDAYKLGMQNIPNEQPTATTRLLSDEKQQEVQLQLQSELEGNVASSCLTAGEQQLAVTPQTPSDSGNILFENQIKNQEVVRNSSLFSDNAIDRSDDKSVVRNAARSISECVEEESIVAGMVGGGLISDDGEDDDDFTTLSEINEPQATFALTTKIDVDNLIDAMDAVNIQPAKESSTNKVANANDDKSQLLSDIDNDSFNSIDFEAEITIAGLSAHSTSNATVTADAQAEGKSSTSSDTIGAFFNHLISQSNAASESVSKLFRQTSASALKVTTKPSSNCERTDTVSTITTVSAADSISFASTCSSGLKQHEVESPVGITSSLDDNTPSETATASTALVAEDNENNMKTIADLSSDEENEKILLRKPKTNPFFNLNSPLKQTIVDLPLVNSKIGTVFEQSLLRYTARLITARFLLSEQTSDFLIDTTVRVSIKSLSMTVLAQCVRLSPDILELTLEISDDELSILSEQFASEIKSPSKQLEADIVIKSSPGGSSNSSTNIGNDYEHVDAADFLKKPSSNIPIKTFLDIPDEPLLLDIKDDHFGKSTCDYLLNTPPLSRSADPVLFAQQLSSVSTKLNTLSKSEIIDTFKPVEHNVSSHVNVTQSTEDAPPTTLPPRPPKRTKSMRKSIVSQKPQSKHSQQSSKLLSTNENDRRRYLADVLLYYSHTDPIMRGGVQQLIGNYIYAAGCRKSQNELLHFQFLLAMLINGLQDEIHTVVIQALNAFDKIFPHVVSKYLAPPPSLHHYLQQQKQQQQHQTQQWQELNKQTLYAASQITIDTKPTKAYEENEVGREIRGKKEAREDKNFDAYQNQQQQQEFSSLERNSTNDVIETATTMTREAAEEAGKRRTTSIELQQQQQLFTDNDELIAALLNAFQLQLKYNYNNNSSSKSHNNINTNAANNGQIHTQASIVAASSSSSTTTATTTTTPISTSTKTIGNDRQNEANNNFDLCVRISPKLLLNKLRLCYHNKYWLIQNKYAEVISNLNYAATLRSYYNNTNYMHNNDNTWKWENQLDEDIENVGDVDDLIGAYETQFLDELLHLLGDDDFRVREHVAACLCQFIISHAKQHLATNTAAIESKISALSANSSTSSTATPLLNKNTTIATNMSYIIEETTCQTNFNLLWDFFDYRIFCGMSLPLRNLFRPYGIAAINVDIDDEHNLHDLRLRANRQHSLISIERRLAEEEKVLSKVLYCMTNKLMQLQDQNLQFGIIRALKVLLLNFNFVDYQRAWSEFNFLEICLKYAHYNYVTATDLNCQKDLIEVKSHLIAGGIVTSTSVEIHAQLQQQLELLLIHIMKFISMYYYVFSNQKPLLFAKVQKSDLFANAKELAIVQSIGYFGNDYVYIKLYNILRSANDSYKISISSETENVFITLLKTCLNTLGLCIELSSSVGMADNKTAMSDSFSTTAASNSGSQESSKSGATDGKQAMPSSRALKLIEESLHYLTKLINYAASECITCLRQLLKYLFARNYGSRRKLLQQQQEKPQEQQFCNHNGTLICCYLTARRCQEHAVNPISVADNQQTMFMSMPKQIINSMRRAQRSDLASATVTSQLACEHYRCFGKLFATALNVHTWKSEHENECAKHIKLFEPLVIFCMTLFMKSNARVQAPIMELLSQLLEHNVTYSILDSKNVIFDQIINNIDLIESGVARNAHIIIPPMIKFLMQLTHKSDRKLITIPKIISLANNLLANNAIRESALLALKCLAYEIFFMPTNSTTTTTTAATTIKTLSSEELDATTSVLLTNNSRELDTQREVILGMLEKFIDAIDCQRVLGLLLLRERCMQQLLHDAAAETASDACAGGAEGAQITTAAKLINNNSLSWLQNASTTTCVEAFVCRVLCGHEGLLRLQVDNWCNYLLLEAFFRNNARNLLADSKEFLALLQVFINSNVRNFEDLSYATIILANVISKTEEIYLVNHIKLYLKNSPYAVQLQFSNNSTSSWGFDGPSTSFAAAAIAQTTKPNISEINYFSKVLSSKLCDAFNVLLSNDACSWQQYAVTLRFVLALEEVCCRSPHKDALQSIFRKVLADSDFLDKYYNFLLMCSSKQQHHIEGIDVNGLKAVLDDETREQQQLLQVEVFKLLSAMKLLDGLLLLQQIQTVGIKWNVQRTLLHEVCLLKKCAMDWNLQQVRQLFGLNVSALEFLITEQFAFLLNLCAADEEFCSLLQNALLEHASALKQYSIRPMLHLIWRVCSPTRNASCSIQCVVKFLQLLAELRRLHTSDRMLLLALERLMSKLLATTTLHNKHAIYDCLKRSTETYNAESNEYVLKLCQKYCFMKEQQDNLHEITTTTIKAMKLENITPLESHIIDEKWLYAQLIKFTAHTNYDVQQLSKILLEIQSEYKLYKIFNTTTFDIHKRVLRHAITSSLKAMLSAFRNNCIQHNPHIHYMQPNPLARVVCALLMTRIDAALDKAEQPAVLAGVRPVDGTTSDPACVAIECGFKIVHEVELHDNIADSVAETFVCNDLYESVIALMQCLKEIETTALLYIEARFIERFVNEHFLSATQLRTLLRFLDCTCQQVHMLLLHKPNDRQQCRISSILRVIDLLLQQKLIWQTLNQGQQGILHYEEGQCILLRMLEILYLAVKQTLQNTNFYQQFKQKMQNEKLITAKACFIAKFIETIASESEIILNKDLRSLDTESSAISMQLLCSIGISLLRTNQFYAYAVTPFEIMQQQLREEQLLATSKSSSKQSSPIHNKEATMASGKMPTIPLESLSDVDVLQNFVKRLSIFGFTTRQQFEEYFMTFLLLINKVYDENMVDQQEQFQIKSTCLQAILELLITYRTFPIVGNKLSHFHHTTRWSRIHYESISLKKLHKVQLLISSSNVFYLANLERQLASDNVIGTSKFEYNQYDLNFVWQQMEAYGHPLSTMASDDAFSEGKDTLAAGDHNELRFGNNSASADTEDVATRNYRYFATMSGVDFKSSSQLIFDVLMQMIEQNHIMVLPNLVKFCEICESRDQIKWIKEKAFKLQEAIPMDDTISHQHLIYLLCRTQAILIPTLGELQQLCLLIGTYLKSSHIFIRNATLSGVLSLLECCSKTNTAIGKLSDELALLRDLIVGYINGHGIIDDSSMNCCDTHLKLVWTLNFCLIEWTSKFVPQCHLLPNAIISASNFLRKTSNEDVYLCILHGLERIVVNNSNASNSNSSSSTHLPPAAGVVTPLLRQKIEKLALELVKLENERFSIPALKLLLSCIYTGSSSQLEITELSNGIVQDDPEIIAQQIDKVDILLHCIKSSTRDAAWIYGQVLCQIIRDLVPPNEILTKVIKEFLAINQPHRDVIAMIVYQVFRSAIDSSFLQMLQDWLICSLPTFLALPEHKGVWSLSVIFISASINLHLIKLFPAVMSNGYHTNSNTSAAREFQKLGQHEIALFVTAAHDFHAKLSSEQKIRFQDAFKKFEQQQVYAKMLHTL